MTNAEIEVLEKNAEEMARNIQAESMVIELGSGLVLGRLPSGLARGKNKREHANMTTVIYAR